MPLDDARRANRANWDDRAAVHVASRTYDVDGFVADPARLSGVVAFDAPRLGEVAGLRLLHLQCHIGTDTLSWARLGAAVTGTDLSPASLAAARDIAARAGLTARFVEAELYDTPAALPGETFDVVYTGVGALNWLPDIAGWARVAAEMLAPGGRLYVRDGHPVLFTLDETRDDLVMTYPYFKQDKGLEWDEDFTYTDGDTPIAHSRHVEWPHSLGEVIGAVLDAGLELTAFEEHREVEWQAMECMEPVGDGRYALPEPLRDRAPLMFTLEARKR